MGLSSRRVPQYCPHLGQMVKPLSPGAANSGQLGQFEFWPPSPRGCRGQRMLGAADCCSPWPLAPLNETPARVRGYHGGGESHESRNTLRRNRPIQRYWQMGNDATGIWATTLLALWATTASVYYDKQRTSVIWATIRYRHMYKRRQRDITNTGAGICALPHKTASAYGLYALVRIRSSFAGSAPALRPLYAS
jgi:hypothetical protein